MVMKIKINLLRKGGNGLPAEGQHVPSSDAQPERSANETERVEPKTPGPTRKAIHAIINEERYLSELEKMDVPAELALAEAGL